MRFSFSFLLSVVLPLALVDGSFAHGPQIQITGGAGKIVTRRLFLDGPYPLAPSAPTSVYVMPLLDYIGASYARPNNVAFVAPDVPEFYSGPGIAYGTEYDAINNPSPFAVGSKFGLSFTAGLKAWNGAAFADAGSAGMQAFTGGFAAPTGTATTSDAGPFASLAIPAGAGTVSFAGAEPNDAHATVRYRFLADGISPSIAADGIYLLSLQFSNTDPGMAASDPFYFVLSKNQPGGNVAAAVASLGFAPSQVQFVPEPASLVLSVCGLLGVTQVIRRRRRHLN